MSEHIILKIQDLGIQFGGLKAVNHFNMEIKEGDLVGLIGPNGAGKTTVFNLITGVYKPTYGKIELDGKNITKLPTYKRVKEGIARTFQNIRLFKSMSVIDNVKVANHIHMSYSIWDATFRTRKYQKEEKETDEKAMEILTILGLEPDKDEIAENLPYGKQRKLEIARALMTNPKLLCLDEPAAGMNPHETEELMKTIQVVRDKYHTTILLIEHDMKLVMGICDWIMVLNFGEAIAKGTPEEIKSNHEVVVAYLGE